MLCVTSLPLLCTVLFPLPGHKTPEMKILRTVLGGSLKMASCRPCSPSLLQVRFSGPLRSILWKLTRNSVSTAAQPGYCRAGVVPGPFFSDSPLQDFCSLSSFLCYSFHWQSTASIHFLSRWSVWAAVPEAVLIPCVNADHLLRFSSRVENHPVKILKTLSSSF